MTSMALAESNLHDHCINCYQGYSCRLNSSCRVVFCPNGCGVWTHTCKMEDHVAEVCELSTVDCPNKTYGCSKNLQRRQLGSHLNSCPANVIRCMFTTMRPSDSEECMGVTVATGPYHRQLCGQYIRRDTFADHMSEHTDTQTGLDGWYEARCPLASQGCSFVYRRLVPTARETFLRFNPEVDALVTCVTGCPNAGGQAAAADAVADNPKCSLQGLPLEVLLHILSMLDGLSLSSLALTCSSMRSACSMLLSTKGCVTRQWKQQEDRKWRLEETRHWQLNRSMEPVRGWRFAEDGLNALQRHLRDCSYNRPEPFPTEPVQVMIK